jgi:hypothetical protein
MYVQSLKTGDVFTYRGQSVTVQSVTPLSGHTDTYEITTTTGRKLRFYAGQKV